MDALSFAEVSARFLDAHVAAYRPLHCHMPREPDDEKEKVLSLRCRAARRSVVALLERRQQQQQEEEEQREVVAPLERRHFVQPSSMPAMSSLYLVQPSQCVSLLCPLVLRTRPMTDRRWR